MEEAAAALSRSIDTGRKDKSQLLADIVDTEKQVSCTPAPVSHNSVSRGALGFWMQQQHWMLAEAVENEATC